jgi:hypothetical protein
MHAILADSIGPGLFWILIFLVGIGCTVVAFAAIFPAVVGRVRPAMLMAVPALVFGILTTLVLIYFWCFAPDTPHPGTPHDAVEETKRFWQTWASVSGIPMALSLFVMLLAVICGQIRKRLAK